MSYRSDRNTVASLRAALEGAAAPYDKTEEIASVLGRCEVYELMRHDANGNIVDYVSIELPKQLVDDLQRHGGATWKHYSRDRRSWQARLVRDMLRRDGWPV